MPSLLDFLAPYLGGIMSPGQPTYDGNPMDRGELPGEYGMPEIRTTPVDEAGAGGGFTPGQAIPLGGRGPAMAPPPVGDGRAPDPASGWRQYLPGVIGLAGSALAGKFMGGGNGLAAAAGFAQNYANAKHQEIQQRRAQQFETEKAIGDTAHKMWQELQGADLSKLPPNLSHLAQQKTEFDQKYAMAIAKDGISPKEAQELISLGTVIKSALPQVKQFSEQETKLDTAAMPYSAAMMGGQEDPEAAGKYLDQGMSEEDAARMGGREMFLRDSLSAARREALGTKSPEALAQEFEQQRALKGLRPPPVGLAPEAESYLLGGKTPGGEYSEEDLEILRARRAAEEARRTALATVSARGALTNDRWNSLDPNLPHIKAAIRNAADRYANGEITWQQGLQTLGGVHGKLGPHFSAAVGERMGLPRHLRDKISSLDQSSEVIDQLEELANDVKAAPTLEAKIEKSLLLESYALSRAGMLARGYSAETGQITDKDVKRATALAPGWKAANFNPDYIDQELAVLRRGIDLQRNAVTSGYFGEYRRDDAGNVTKTPFGPPPTGGLGRPTTAEEYLKKLQGGGR